MVLSNLKLWVANNLTADDLDRIEYAARYDRFNQVHLGFIYTGTALTNCQKYRFGMSEEDYLETRPLANSLGNHGSYSSPHANNFEVDDRTFANEYAGEYFADDNHFYRFKIFDVKGAFYPNRPNHRSEYVVVITEVGASCSCNHVKRNNAVCKHILYVLRVKLNVPVNQLLNDAFIKAHLAPIFAAMT